MLSVGVSRQAQHFRVAQRANLCRRVDRVIRPLASGLFGGRQYDMANSFPWLFSPVYACLRVNGSVRIWPNQGIQKRVYWQRLSAVSQARVKMRIEIRRYT